MSDKLANALLELIPQNDPNIEEYDYFAMGYESGWNRCVERISEIISKHKQDEQK